MTRSGWYHQRLTGMEMQRFILQHKRHLTVDHLNERIKRCLMLTQPLSFVKREHGDAACLVVLKLTADHTALGIIL